MFNNLGNSFWNNAAKQSQGFLGGLNNMPFVLGGNQLTDAQQQPMSQQSLSSLIFGSGGMPAAQSQPQAQPQAQPADIDQKKLEEMISAILEQYMRSMQPANNTNLGA